MTAKELRREAQMFDTDMIMGCTDAKWLVKVCQAQNKTLYEAADEIERLERKLRVQNDNYK